MRRRQCQRFTKRLESTFSSGGAKYRGISSDISAGGLFIRTQNGFMPGTIVDVEIYLPDNKASRVKGIVRRTIKTSLATAKNGMGIELIERDSNYFTILRDFAISGLQEEQAPQQPRKAGHHDQGQEAEVKDEGVSPEKKGYEGSSQHRDGSVIITCQKCQAKNRVVKAMLLLGPKCGRCGEILDTRLSG